MINYIFKNGQYGECGHILSFMKFVNFKNDCLDLNENLSKTFILNPRCFSISVELTIIKRDTGINRYLMTYINYRSFMEM